MRIVSVVGARPQFVKLAPVAVAAVAAGHDHVIVHTGQHYDDQMSQVFFADLAIPRPQVDLAIGSGSHGQQTSRMLAALEPVLVSAKPDWVLVYGDTNSTLAAALAAVKVHLLVAHLEAGLRSGNRRMPEEHNRVLTDHAADLLLAPTRAAMDNLAAEGLASRAVHVGDVMTDICFRVRDRLGPGLPAAVRECVVERDYVLATLHRPDNTDDPTRLAALLDALRRLPVPVVLPAHPRLRDRAARAGIELEGGALRVLEPLGYPDMVAAVRAARGVVTDSGGLQKEAYLLARPCTTVRTETEWPETLTDGWNVLAPDAGDDLTAAVLRARPRTQPADHFGDGHAAEAVVAALTRAAGTQS